MGELGGRRCMLLVLVLIFQQPRRALLALAVMLLYSDL